MLTVVVKASRTDLQSKLAGYGLGSMAKDAKTRDVTGMVGCIAVQHPTLVKMGADAIFDLCRFAGIALEFVTDAPEMK